MVLSDYLITADATVLQAMEKIDQNSKGMVYVVSDAVLKGVVTDGDIRRFLLHQGDLKQNIFQVANKAPLSLKLGEEELAKELMETKDVRSVPILDENGRILKICFREETVENKKEAIHIPVVIMAGGKGTRLYPYTQILPKPLMPIGEKTITEHIMERFEQYSCKEFTMIVNYKKHFIKSYFDDHEFAGKVNFVEEKEFLGTGGGLRLLSGRFTTPFFMTNCDILIEEDYADILRYHREQKNLVTMVCAVKNMTIPYGTVEVTKDNKAVGLQEKPELTFLTNTGFYILEPEFIERIPENTFIHITDIIQKCIEEGKNVGVYKIPEEHWLDMGQLEELERMKLRLNVQ